MTVQRVTPDGMLQPVFYDHVAVGVGARQIHIAGQTARPAGGGSVAELDLATQIAAALRQIGVALTGVGATFDDVVRLTCYLPDWDESKTDAFTDGLSRVVEELHVPQPWPPVTVIGVAALWAPDLLVEIEAYAVLD